jgi:hypothetical protein
MYLNVTDRTRDCSSESCISENSDYEGTTLYEGIVHGEEKFWTLHWEKLRG